MSSGVDTINLTVEKEITEDEAKLYDRQIRLWGVTSQKMLRKANVLCISLSGLASEVVKNIVLAGINSLTVMDDAKISGKDSFSNILTRNKIGSNRAQVAVDNIRTLNPMVQVKALDWNIHEKLKSPDEEFLELLKSCNVVFITNHDPEIMIQLNELCRSFESHSISFFAACDWGFYGFSFTDLGRKYKYVTEEVIQKEIDTEEPSLKKLKTEQPEKTYVEKHLDFVPLKHALTVKSGKAGIGITKKTSSVLILVHLLFKFYRLKSRYPDPSYRSEDEELIKKMLDEIADELEYPKSSLRDLEADEFFHHLYGELSPVSAIIGGVLGQDIIRSITHQDAPIRNFFLFNGLRCAGSVESIGK